MPRRKRVTLGQMIVSGGWRETRQALRYVSRYGLACQALGHPPTIEEYRQFHGLSQAQAYRDQQSWRKCVPGFTVLEVVSSEALASRGLTEEEREDLIARELSGG